MHRLTPLVALAGVRKQSCIMRRCVRMNSNGGGSSSSVGGGGEAAASEDDALNAELRELLRDLKLEAKLADMRAWCDDEEVRRAASPS